MPNSFRWARLLMAAAVAVTLLPACDADEPAAPPAAAPAAAPGEAEVRALLADSWVTDGRHGYFVDDAWSPTRSPFSLYDTYWQLRLARQQRPDAAVLDPGGVGRWLPAALRGGQAGSPLPAMAQISYAVQVASVVGMSGAAAGPAIESLRAGGRYRTGTATDPNWGSTALAVEALATAGLPVPDAVRSGIRSGLSAAGGPPHTAATAVETLIPQLQAAAALDGAGLDAGLLAVRVREAFDALGDTPDVVWLGAQARLRADALRLGVEPPPFPRQRCDDLRRPDGTIGLPGQPAADPQLTYYARALGCTRIAVPPAPPHSRAGWPATAALARAQGATLAGLRLARVLGAPDPAMDERLRATLLEAWLPAAAAADALAGVEGTLLASRLRSLAALVAPAERDRVGGALARAAHDHGDDLQRLLALVDAAHLDGDAERRAAAHRVTAAGPPRTASIFTAAGDELASRLLGGDPALHASATAGLAPLRVGGGLHAVEPGPAGTAAAGTGSLTATVLAAWIAGAALPVGSWAERGLCRAGGCGENAAEAAERDGTSLRILALMWMCAAPRCGDDVPLLL